MSSEEFIPKGFMSPYERVHIRKRTDAAGKEPVYCGATMVSTVTDAWGYWGPTGDGYQFICKECERVKKNETRK